MRVRVLRRCGTSSNHVALLLSSLFHHLHTLPLSRFPSSCASNSRHFPSPCAFTTENTLVLSIHARRVERLCFYLRRRPILRTLSQRRNQRRVTCGNGRKEEGSARHFQARSTKRRQKRCQTIIPESGIRETNGIVDESFNRYVSRVLS